MMNQRGIVHPALLARVRPGFYPSLCTVQELTAVQDEYGEEIQSYVDVPNHVDIACRIAPRSSREQREAQQVYAEATHHVALGGHYPAILPAMRVLVDGLAYAIEGPPQHDGNQQMTRLYVREAI
jgi:SPP1 family predicted phage head-tail adaptor